MPTTPRYANAAQHAMVGLLLASGRLQRALGAVLEAHGITPDQYNVLRILRGAGPEGLPRYEVAARMIYRAPDATRLLDRLEARDLVARARSTEDRRLSLTRITRAGRALLDRLEPDVVAVHERLASALGAAERRELARLCDLVEG